MAVAVIQEFPIEGDDRTTKGYDQIQVALGTGEQRADGELAHAAGFDEAAGIFRIFSVWESQEAWDTFFQARLMPAVRSMSDELGPPPETRIYQLHRFSV